MAYLFIKAINGLFYINIIVIVFKVTTFNTTFNNISVITGVPGKKQNTHLSQVTDKLYYILLYLVHVTMSGIPAYTLVVIIV